jgi:putative transcriptional regulator
MSSHHASEATLAAYAAGTLPEAIAIVAAVHLAQCVTCRRSLSVLETTGGILLDELPPVPLQPGAFDRLDPRLDAAMPDPPDVLNADLPAPLNRVPFGRWWPLAFGARYRPMRVGGVAWGGLIFAQPGRSMPPHDHVGLELTCILSGSLADGHGTYVAGDLSEPITDHHQPPVAVGTEPCICIIASEGVRLRGLLGRAQRMMGY